jgi:hypothetical protein
MSLIHALLALFGTNTSFNQQAMSAHVWSHPGGPANLSKGQPSIDYAKRASCTNGKGGYLSDGVRAKQPGSKAPSRRDLHRKAVAMRKA